MAFPKESFKSLNNQDYLNQLDLIYRPYVRELRRVQYLNDIEKMSYRSNMAKIDKQVKKHMAEFEPEDIKPDVITA